MSTSKVDLERNYDKQEKWRERWKERSGSLAARRADTLTSVVNILFINL